MRLTLLCFALAAASCRNEAPQSPTAEQSDQLNEAEDMLDQLGNEKGPAPESTGPSNRLD